MSVKAENKSIYEYIEDPKATETLPSLASVIKELEMMTEKKDILIDDITRVVRSDQSMSLRVLRIANSAYFAPAEPILEVQNAVLYIGLSNLRSSIITAQCIEKTCLVDQNVLPWKAFWTHAIAVGCIMKILSRNLQVNDLNTESFYVMGLMHDIGKVVLAHLSPDDFTQIYTECAKGKKLPSTLELEILGIDHGHLGAWYLQQQGIPPAIFEPVRLHHTWNRIESEPNKYGALLNLADQLTRSVELGNSGNRVMVSSPYESEEWKIFLELCGVPESREEKHREEIRLELETIPDLVHSLLT